MCNMWVSVEVFLRWGARLRRHDEMLLHWRSCISAMTCLRLEKAQTTTDQTGWQTHRTTSLLPEATVTFLGGRRLWAAMCITQPSSFARDQKHIAGLDGYKKPCGYLNVSGHTDRYKTSDGAHQPQLYIKRQRHCIPFIYQMVAKVFMNYLFSWIESLTPTSQDTELFFTSHHAPPPRVLFFHWNPRTIFLLNMFLCKWALKCYCLGASVRANTEGILTKTPYQSAR